MRWKLRAPLRVPQLTGTLGIAGTPIFESNGGGSSGTSSGSSGSDGTETPAYMAALGDYEVLQLTSAANGKATLNSTMPVAWQGLTGGTYGNNANITAAFSGGACNPIDGDLYINGGGHGDSANNGLWRYRFRGTTLPTGWELLDISPSPASVSANTDPTSTSPSRPISIHTYNGLGLDPDTNRLFRFGGGQWDSGAMPTKNWYFDVEAGTWSQTPNTPYAANNPVVTIIDEVSRKALIISHSGDGWFYRIDTNTAGNNISEAQQAFDSVGSYDPTRHRGYLWAPNELWEVDIDWVAETVSMTEVTPTGDTGVLAGSTGAMFYDYESDVHWLFPLVEGSTSMTLVYSMTPSLVITAHATNGDNTGFDTDGWTGSYNKICPMLQWNRCVGIVTGIDDPPRIIRLPIV